ncbi:hypothetical protein ACFC26_32950, partial [Kitasatospora purpeofusca]
MTVHLLHAPGNGGTLTHSAGEARDLDKELDQDNVFPGIQTPAVDGQTPDSVPGFHIEADHFAWFQHALARTGAAGLTAFAGEAAATVPYLTGRQGRKRYEGISHAAIGSVQEADHELLGIPFVGTDHVLCLNRTRVEAFSGGGGGPLRTSGRGPSHPLPRGGPRPPSLVAYRHLGRRLGRPRL